MKIYGAQVVMARQSRGLKRCDLAKKLQMTTAQLREIERTRGYQECGCCPLEVEINEMVLHRLVFALHYPRHFFFNLFKTKFSKDVFFCQSLETSVCWCGEQATLLCDFEQYDMSTCDNPLCAKHAISTGKGDYCLYHGSDDYLSDNEVKVEKTTQQKVRKRSKAL